VWLSCQLPKAYGDDFIRGDISTDSKIGITDAAILGTTFSPAGAGVRCEDALDIDDNSSVEDSDFALLVEYLTRLSETATIELPDPFPVAGADPTPDLLDCQAGSGSDPGSANGAYIFDWDGPPRAAYALGAEVDIFLEVTTADAINGFSLAYRLNTNVLNLISVDFMDVNMADGDRRALESSTGFSWSLAARDAAGFSLLLVATVLLDGGFEPILFPPTQRAVNAFNLLHIRARVNRVPTVGTVILKPFDGTYMGLGNARGTVNEVSITPAIPPTLPGFPDEFIHIINDSSEIFFRGDSNADAVVDISDGIYTLGYSFQGGPQPKILDAADANDDGTLDISDAVYTFGFLFLGGPPPPPPFTVCGEDVTPDFLFATTSITACGP
jgi:hypothetical protein